MLKRLCKNTAIIAAAAAIFCSVPANAAATLKTMNGTIKSAAAFDGSYIYNGHKADSDADSVYFSTGDNETEINNAKFYSFKFDEKYGDKYIVAKEFKDQKFDLSSGKIENEFLEDIEKNLTSQLEEKFKDVSRYNNDYKPVIKRIDKSSFSEPWYQYYTEKYTGFTDINGAYIDASYVANISVISKDGRFVTIKNYNQNYSGLTAKFINTNVIAQDESYIYALTNIAIAGDEAPSDSNLTYLQKISKKQVNNDDGVYIPSSVESYEVTNKFKSAAAESAYSILNNSAKVFINDGDIYLAQKISGTQINVTKLVLKNEAVELNKNPGTVYNMNLVEIDSDITHDTSAGAN